MDAHTTNRIVNGIVFGSLVTAGAVVYATIRYAGVPPPPAPPRVAQQAQQAQAPAPFDEAVTSEFEASESAPVVGSLGQSGEMQSFSESGRSDRSQQRRTASGVSEPDARRALAWVGRDPAAVQVWMRAINDTENFNARARRNLIEDLNEEGFEDPWNLTADDLPLIESRLALIEALYEDAADEVNAAAFDEAYDDLLNMRARLMAR